MKRLSSIITFAAILLMFNPLDMVAQKGAQMKAPYKCQNRYDQNTVETFSAEITKIEKIKKDKAQFYGIHFQVKSDTESLTIHLGPGWYIENQERQFKPGDKVEITGSRIVFDENPAIIASRISIDDQSLVLRDEQGFPMWSGWRKRI